MDSAINLYEYGPIRIDDEDSYSSYHIHSEWSDVDPEEIDWNNCVYANLGVSKSNALLPHDILSAQTICRNATYEFQIQF